MTSPGKPINKFSISELEEFLKNEGISEKVISTFKEEEVDGSTFVSLTKHELKEEFEFKLGARKKLEKLIQKAKKQCSAKDSSGSEDDVKDPQLEGQPRGITSSGSHGHTGHTHNSKPWNRKDVSIVFLGETGAGKSTLLQSIQDYFNAKRVDEIKPTSKEPGQEVGESQTQGCSLTTCLNPKWRLNIIDTPGLGDTKGVKKDEQHVNRIVDFLIRQAEFNTICLVLKRGANRNTVRLRYIIDEIRTNLPRDVKDNFMVVLTYSPLPYVDRDTKAVIEKLNLPTKNIICINNAMYEDVDWTNMEDMQRKQMKRKLKSQFEENQSYIELLIEEASKFKSYKSDSLRELRERRNKLKVELHKSKGIVDATFEVEGDLKKEMAQLERMKTQKSRYKDYNWQKAHTNVKTVSSGTVNTVCTVCSSRICHAGCGLGHGSTLSGCAAMNSSGWCHGCDHHWKDHAHTGWTTEKEVTYSTEVDHDKKKKFEDAKSRIQLLESEQKKKEKQIAGLKKQREDQLKLIAKIYEELENMAIIGHNESLEAYLKECKKQTEKDATLSHAQREDKIKLFDDQISFWGTIKESAKYVKQKLWG